MVLVNGRNDEINNVIDEKKKTSYRFITVEIRKRQANMKTV